MPKIYVSWEDRVKIIDMYCNTDLTAETISRIVGLSPRCVVSIVKKHLSVDKYDILKKYKMAKRSGREFSGNGLKQCRFCLNYLVFSEFYYYSDSIDGMQSYCRS